MFNNPLVVYLSIKGFINHHGLQGANEHGMLPISMCTIFLQEDLLGGPLGVGRAANLNSFERAVDS